MSMPSDWDPNRENPADEPGPDEPGEPTQEPMRAAAECPEWVNDSSNLADLIEWLDEQDEIVWEASHILYMLRKPWKWDKEYQQMRESQRIAEADAREEESVRR